MLRMRTGRTGVASVANPARRSLEAAYGRPAPRAPRRRAGAGDAPATISAHAPAARRSLARAASDECHDGRRGPAAARVSRHPRRGAPAALGARGSALSRRADGSWANFAGGPGRPLDDDRGVLGPAVGRRRADRTSTWSAPRRGSRDHGGPRQARVFTHIWMALFGLWPWDEVPALPPELVFLPSWFPLNPYDFACWARQTIVALTIVRAHRPVRAARLHARGARSRRAGASTQPRDGSLAGRCSRLDRAAARLRAAAATASCAARTRAAERWVVQRQEADGSWGGIQPPWVYSLMALQLQGYPLDHPVMRAGLDGLDAFTVDGAMGVQLARGLPVAGLGHRARDHRARRRRHRPRRSGAGPRRRLAARPADHRTWRATGRSGGPNAAAGRVGVRIPQRQLPGYR